MDTGEFQQIPDTETVSISITFSFSIKIKCDMIRIVLFYFIEKERTSCILLNYKKW